MLDDLNTLETEALAQLEAASTPDALEQWRIAFLGSKGRLKAAAAGLKDVPKSDKPAVGKRLNEVKKALEAAFKARQANAAGASPGARSKGASGGGGGGIDVTEPGIAPPIGRRHIITRVRDEICEVFSRMGFEVAAERELEDDEHNFAKLNIPDGHPAREPIDNFYVDEPDCSLARLKAGDASTRGSEGVGGAGAGPRMLRSQTSTVQIRVMQDAIAKGWGPPLKIVAPGRVYRPDTVDATHSFMFHQIEGLYVDTRVTLIDLKTTLFQFARSYFGHDAEVRFRPSFFPFTEPSAEFDMMIALDPAEPPKWIELGGCGLVDPAVFESVGLDPEEWMGFAFGFGIERIAMGRYAIPDIRLLYENDLRFLQQL